MDEILNVVAAGSSKISLNTVNDDLQLYFHTRYCNLAHTLTYIKSLFSGGDHHFWFREEHPAPTPSSLWAAPALIPESTFISDNTTNTTTTDPSPTSSQTITWAPQVPTPSHPELLGHNHHMSQPLNLSIPLSPIPVISPNTNPYE